MAKNHEADMSNANTGTSGTNETYQKAQDNHSRQIQEHKEKGKSK